MQARRSSCSRTWPIVRRVAIPASRILPRLAAGRGDDHDLGALFRVAGERASRAEGLVIRMRVQPKESHRMARQRDAYRPVGCFVTHALAPFPRRGATHVVKRDGAFMHVRRSPETPHPPPFSPTNAPHPRPFSPRSGEKGAICAVAAESPLCPAHGRGGLGVRASVWAEGSSQLTLNPHHDRVRHSPN